MDNSIIEACTSLIKYGVRPVFLGKRTKRDDFFFPNKKYKIGLDMDMGVDVKVEVECIEMKDFPPMMWIAPKYKTIVIRDAYKIMFEDLKKTARECLNETGMNITVTGNPGVGKSRFYLYCIYMAITTEYFKDFQIVINFKDQYEVYNFDDQSFYGLGSEKVKEMAASPNVLRFVEANSDRLGGWTGVSILFASPGISDPDKYFRDSKRYIMPVWSKGEVEKYNSILDQDLQLPVEILRERFEKVGGIPRFVFIDSGGYNKYVAAINAAIATHDPFDIIKYASSEQEVDQKAYSHRLLQMVPTGEHFLSFYQLEFVSEYVRQLVFERVDEATMRKLSKFAYIHADEPTTRSIRGFIYECLGFRV